MESYLEIIQLINAQDKLGLEKLYNKYGSKFYSYCLRNWALSEDEAWEVIYRTLETLILKISNYKFATQADFERFIYKVLINYLRQQYRSKKLKEKDSIVYVDFNAETGASSQLAEYFNADALNAYYSEETENPDLLRLNKALDEIEQISKDLLLLRAQNYSYDEIAELLKIDNNQLKVKHHRARKKLLEILNNETIIDHGKQKN